MPVDNPGVIDFVGIDKETGEVILTVADALPWNECEEHLLLLQEKINRYMGFIQHELPSTYPKAQGRKVRIDVVFREALVPGAETFLTAAELVVRQNGWALSWRVADAA